MEDPISFDQLRRANLARVVMFPGHVNDERDIDAGTLAGWTYNDWMVAVTGEIGELASLLKVRRRGWSHSSQTVYTNEAVANELADIVTYLDLLAACLGVNLGEAVAAKYDVVSRRAQLPFRFGDYADSEANSISSRATL